MKFSKYNISEEVKRSIQEAGFSRPTDIQFKAIPSILNGDDVLAIAQTGTGKTAAFAIPVIHKLQTEDTRISRSGIRCLVMVPTRELAIQITDVFKSLAKYTKLRITSVIGGLEQDPQIAALLTGTDVLVATPGRMFDLISQGFLKTDSMQVLILDEADHMLDKGFINDIRQLIRILPKKRQTLFFSATINPEIKKLAYSLVHNPIRIQISPKDPVSRNVDHSVAYISMDEKRFFLERLLRENPESKVLVFVRTKVRAERVMNALARVGIEAGTIHGDKDQHERLATIDSFRKGSRKVLIATDVSARGIDIPAVDFVVNYDLPEQPENYVHRIGRTGRGTKRGNAVSFCSDEEKAILQEITEYIGKEVKVLDISESQHEETLDFSNSAPSDWKSLIAEEESNPNNSKKKKRR